MCVTPNNLTPRSTVDLQAFYDERVAAQDAQVPGYASSWRALATLILTNGGRAVVPPPTIEEDLRALLSGTCTTRKVRLVKGPPNSCHETTALAWFAGKLDAVVTGYALSEDGLWRQHSWGLSNNVVIEPTEKRTAYFGIELHGEAANEFATNQL